MSLRDPSPSEEFPFILTTNAYPQLIDGLHLWFQRGLLNAQDIEVLFRLSPQHPELLAGLEEWLRLGLLDEGTIQRLSRKYLTCELPELAQVRPSRIPFSVPTLERATPTWLDEKIQSLQAELSVRWLLFLGVFMVIVSSGVMAATQWQNFLPLGQYGVLLAYSLTFFGVSAWATRQQNLHLTTQSLQLVTGLLIPLNFWAIDELGLWQSPLNWGIIALASIALMGITFWLGKQHHQSIWVIGGYLACSYLHWGWGETSFPGVAVYLGIAGVAAITLTQGFSSFLAYAISLLLFRAIFIEGVAISSLGLAVGVLGWLVLRLTLTSAEEKKALSPLMGLGGLLLVVGWGIAFSTAFPWQGIILSILGFEVFYQRLRRFWHSFDFLAIISLGLPTLWMLWELIPGEIQTNLVIGITTFTQTEDSGYGLLSVMLFPYLIFILSWVNWFYGQRKENLAQLGEKIALGLGSFFGILSFAHPLTRSLTLLNLTLTVAIFRRRDRPLNLHRRFSRFVYATHILGLATLVSGIAYLIPHLQMREWTIIFLTLMVGELVYSVSPPQSHTGLISKSSAYYLGLALATLSYALLWDNRFLAFSGYWGLLALVIPVSLTAVIAPMRGKRKLFTTGLSITSLLIVQGLTLESFSTSLISFGVATVVMVANTSYLPTLWNALLTVIFGLAFGFTLLSFLIPLSFAEYGIATAFTIFGLWLIQKLHRHNHSLYAKAMDILGIVLTITLLSILTLFSFRSYWEYSSPSLAFFGAGLITFGAIIYRSFPQPNNFAFYALAWNLEVLAVAGASSLPNPVISLTLINFCLGILAQLAGDWWQRRQSLQRIPLSWHIIPLLYGVLAASLRWGLLTRWTGFTTFALALILIGVGRRRESFKPLIYLAIVGVSVSAYEMLFYSFSQMPGEAMGDGLIAMAGLGTAIMYAYRLLTPWLTVYLSLSAKEIRVVSHIHWGWSLLLLVTASLFPTEAAAMVGIGVGIALIQYALFQGRGNHPSHTWVYLGFVTAAALRFYWLRMPFVEALGEPLSPWKVAIAALIAAIIYLIPWENLGWLNRPWRNLALVLPFLALLESIPSQQPLSLIIAASFYFLPAFLHQQITYTYPSLIFLIFGAYLQFFRLNLSHPLWYIAPLGIALLYITHVDPRLQTPQNRQLRHLFRLVGSGLICLVALWNPFWFGLVAGVISLITLGVGLSLKVRAYLYMGTATFLMDVLYQLGFLMFDFPFSKWIIGFVVGILFIWIAATFETRREQIIGFIDNRLLALQSWD